MGVKLDFLLYEENSVRVCGNRVLKGIFGPEQTLVTGEGGGPKSPSEKTEDCIVHQILLVMTKSGKFICMGHVTKQSGF